LAIVNLVWQLAVFGPPYPDMVRQSGLLPHVVAMLAHPVDEYILKAAGCVRNLAANNGSIFSLSPSLFSLYSPLFSPFHR